jgi:hypothetical protein
VLGRGHVQADDVADLGDELRSLLSFHVCTRCGLRPKARQIRDTDDCDRPLSAAIVLVDQWLSCPGPFSLSVRLTSTSTCSSVILRAAPGRGRSPRAPIRPSRNRTRHLRTDSRDSPVCSATLVSGIVPPCSAQASTTRARSATDCDALRLRDKASSDARSASDSTRGTSFGLGTSQAYYLRSFQRLRTLADWSTSAIHPMPCGRPVVQVIGPDRGCSRWPRSSARCPVPVETRTQTPAGIAAFIEVISPIFS